MGIERGTIMRSSSTRLRALVAGAFVLALVLLIPVGAESQTLPNDQVVRICKQSTAGNPVTGNFTFMIDVLSGPTTGAHYTLTVPVGPCAGGLGATNWLLLPNNALVRITEQGQVNTSVAAITLSGGLSSTVDLPNRQLVFSVGPFGSVVTFRNQGPNVQEPCYMEVCKDTVPANASRLFTFRVHPPAGPDQIVVSPGGGACSGPILVASGAATVTETVPSGWVMTNQCHTVPTGALVSCDSATHVAMANVVGGDISTQTLVYFKDTCSLTSGCAADDGDVSATGTCTRTIAGDIVGDLDVSSGTTCIAGGTITGNVVVHPGAQLSVTNGDVGGSITAIGASALTMCQSAVGGDVTVQGSSGFVLIGDGGDGPPAACLGNDIGGDVQLGGLPAQGNIAPVEFSGNNVGQSLTVTSNTGGTELEANNVGTDLVCSGNAPVPTNDSLVNTVGGSRSGPACAAAGF
jgi:hypothetical protein